MPETRTIRCPFCKEVLLRVLYIPSRVKELKKTSWGGNKKAYTRTREVYDVLTEKCPNCGKSKKEIEKRLKGDKQPSREEVIRRMKEMGMDPSKMR